MARTAAVFAWLSGHGFGLPAIRYLGEHDAVWTFMGFPTYGEGPFERSGVFTSVLLLVAFCLVCIAELLVGWLLWTGQRSGLALPWAGLVIGGAVVLERETGRLRIDPNGWTLRSEDGSRTTGRLPQGPVLAV